VSDDIVTMRARSVANLRRLQRLADNDFRNDRDRSQMLRLQLDAEGQIVKLLGTAAPIEQNLNVKTTGEKDTLSTADLLQRAQQLETLASQLLAEEAGHDGDGMDLDG
jgi:hypothetical protein